MLIAKAGKSGSLLAATAPTVNKERCGSCQVAFFVCNHIFLDGSILEGVQRSELVSGYGTTIFF